MQNILIPTDFSAEAHNALEVALQLARRTGGHLTLLHVVDAPAGSTMVTTGGVASGSAREGVFMIELLKRTKQRMHELMAEVARMAPEVAVQDCIATGTVNEAVLEVIREQHFDLVVVGAHEHAPTLHLFTPDSLAEHLVRLAPCPVLTVKHPAPDFAVRSIVFASDFSPEADKMLPSLRQLQAAFPEATLHLLDVVTQPNGYAEAIDHIHAFANRHQLPAYEPDVFNAPQVRLGIPRYAAQNHADLVVMLTHGHTGLLHLFGNNIAESVALQAAAPVLTLHPQ
ncbi:Nucleotide-binding universal stress protein, UspA family [Hymenobacter daecheongensis DSM 21074]|uniref:Nucleotide-binding universal stress protein, UspA family n=1 Tax=Hymenobacter daecheongensis DSM 21074 TaxID=1121955 RepID=A0A1M6EW49_9BACT|nr:universal stress protein [Hymenobacter daecheongensis]SHI89601.1 Nucleotide-binding universal stress protein, UspA family [Hymenobacter daecheongensis DSM 21074]